MNEVKDYGRLEDESYFTYSTAEVHSMENTEPVIYDSTEDILAKEIKSWKGFEYALREESRILFNKCYEKKAHILV